MSTQRREKKIGGVMPMSNKRSKVSPGSSADKQSGSSIGTRRDDKRPELYKFAWFKRVDETYEKLWSLCLKEDWDRFDRPGKSSHQLLRNYLESTFVRLKQEGKISVGKQHAAFNTGLVDEHYSDIFALFKRNDNTNHQEWVIEDFVRQDKSATYTRMCKEFGNLPMRASYTPVGDSLIFDVDKGLDLNHKHIICERAFRLPISFLARTLSPCSDEAKAIIDKAVKCADTQQRENLLEQELLPLLPENSRPYLALFNALNDARDRTLQRIRLNYTVAIPHYYPAKGQFGFILPLYLTYEEIPDCILLASKDRKGSGYFGATILPPEKAINNSRPIMKPCKNWILQLCQHYEGNVGVAASDEEMLTPVVTSRDDDGTARITGMGVDHEINNGDTIGCLRRPDQDAPDIVLREAESAWGISQIHGTFWLRDGQWSFINKGRNGTRVRRNGVLEDLQHQVPFILRPEDELIFGNGSPVRFQCSAAEDDDVTPILMSEVRMATEPISGFSQSSGASLQGNGIECSLVTGMTIGCVRDSTRESPDIVVPVSDEANKYVSQMHGRFGLADGRWHYTQLGKNGSVIVRGGVREMITDRSEPYALENGDNIILSEDAPAITFFC